MPVLAAERVRYVGEPVAIVIAETAAQAQDAAEAVDVELDALAGVAGRRARNGAGCASDLARTRRATSRSTGRTATRRRSMQHSPRAAHVERVRLLDTRVAPSAMEPRAAIGASTHRAGRYTLIAPHAGRGAWCARSLPKAVFKVPAKPDPRRSRMTSAAASA